MANVLPNGVIPGWRSDGPTTRRAVSAWLKNGIGGSSGADAARYLISPPAIPPVDLNSRVGAMARERGWDPCRLSHEQRRQLIDEVMATVPRQQPPKPVNPRPLTPSEQHAVDRPPAA